MHATKPNREYDPSSLARLRAKLHATNTRAIGMGFTAGILVISLAVTYTLYGNANDQPLETGHSSSQAAPKSTERLPSTDQTKQEEATTMNDESTNSAGQGGSGSTSNSSTSVTVNGQQIDLPENGSYSGTIDNGTSQTKVESNSSHSSSSSQNGNSSSSSSRSSVNINISSESRR